LGINILALYCDIPVPILTPINLYFLSLSFSCVHVFIDLSTLSHILLVKASVGPQHVPQRAKKLLRGARDIAVPIHNHSARRGRWLTTRQGGFFPGRREMVPLLKK